MPTAERSRRFVSFSVESLEQRCLLAAAPWGDWPQLIRQDAAAMHYPDVRGAGQTIAILDSGVDYRHPALGGGFGPGHKVVDGFDFVDDDPDPMDEDGHGTAVAGMAAASEFTFNGQQFRGIAPDAQIVALRVDNNFRWHDLSPRIEAALQWVIDHRAQYNIVSVNISLGYGHFTTEAAQTPFGDELAQLAAAGVFVVSSSGNDGALSPAGIEYPGADPNAFSAGSITLDGAISTFTERGPTMDILAPGDHVTTTYFDTSTGKHTFINAATGTSFASPIIAGAAALLRQADPALSPAQIMAMLQETGTSNFDGDDEQGPTTGLTFKQLNLDAALGRIIGQIPGVGATTSYNDIAFDASGTLHLAYYDAAAAALKYARRSPGGDWSSITVIPDASRSKGQYLSLAVDSHGLPGVSYYDAFNADLKYAHFNGSGWVVQTADGFRSVGLYTSLGFDGGDRPVISYYDKSRGGLKLAMWTGSAWSTRTLDEADDSGRHSSLALNPATGRWAVAYENSTTGEYRFAQQKASGSWGLSTVDDTQGGGGYISLAFDSGANPAFSYYDAWNADLKFAHFDGSHWRVETVASRKSQGLYTNLFFDAVGRANILYFNKSSDSLMMASGDIGEWGFLELIGGGGRNVALALDAAGQPTYTWGEPGVSSLHVQAL